MNGNPVIRPPFRQFLSITRQHMFKSVRQLRYLIGRKEAIQLVILFIAILIMAILKAVGIASVLPFMQLAAQPEIADNVEWVQWLYATCAFPSEREFLIAVGCGVLLVLAVSNGFTALTTWLQHRFAWSMAHRVSVRLVRTYTALPYQFFLTRNSADLIKKTISEVNDLINGVLLAGTEFVAQLIVSLVILLLLTLVQPMLAVVAIGVLGGIYGLVFATRHGYMARLGQKRVEVNYHRYKTFVEIITGIKTVKTTGAQEYFLGRFEAASQSFSRIHPQFQFMVIAPRYVIETLVFGGIVSMIVYLLLGPNDLLGALPVLSLYAFAAYRLVPSFNSMFTTAAQIRHHIPVVDNILSDITRVAATPNATAMDSTSQIQFDHCITLENICFKYDNAEEWALEEFDLAIPKGSRVAFIGSTGSGKTTLVDVIIGLLFPQQGRMLVDSVAITIENANRWHCKTGYVPQEVFLYDDTVARNIAFGVADDRLDMNRIREAARSAQIDDFVVNELSNGYHTEIGERGVRLSGGERQRIGLARALYRKPQVLILDEATSALDGITEEAVIRAIQETNPSLTLIMVAHRLSTVKSCETLYLIEGGQIRDHGSYEQLLATNEVFRDMVRLTS